MSRKTDIFKNVLTTAYNNDAFVGFIQELLNDIEMVAPTTYNKVYNNFSYYVDGYYHIGNYTGNDDNRIAVFSVALKKGDSVERARTMQRNFIKPLLENSMCAGALVAFYTADEPEKWRLSFIRLDYELSKGKVTENLTPARRYSYLVGKGEPCNTAKQRLFPIFNNDNDNPDVDELEEAFSVEKVTNEFFQLYCEKFHNLREYLESNEEFMQEAEYRHFTSEQFAKKLLGQIVFLYFIQKKGWLGVEAIPVTMTEKEYKNAFFARGQKSREIVGNLYVQQVDGSYRIVVDKLQKLSDEDEELLAGIVKGKPWGTGKKDFMRWLFTGAEKNGKNYFDDYLEPLFYTGLNMNRGENGFYSALHRCIPFLNGGLFEQLDNYEWENNNFDIPNSIFSNVAEKGRNADGILDIFDRYNFTMNEDEPMEREVAIDPEMLGKVFENLLDIKDRKSKGAFYTPREIVHYMCQETLISYLSNKSGISIEAIGDFVKYGEYMRDEDTAKTKKVVDASGKIRYEFDKEKKLYISKEILNYANGTNRLEELDDLLANVKVADLAVGSGAFPLGMVSEIVKARAVLTEYLSIGMRPVDKLAYINYGRSPYELKTKTIKNSIFACDIDPSAVDIAKLRLWLSIVIDDEISDSNRDDGIVHSQSKPRQLPNLDCNIICGNSLIDRFNGNKLITESSILNNMSEGYQINAYQMSVEAMIDHLIDLQDKLFFTKEHSEKEEIRLSIQKVYDDIIYEQLSHDSETIEQYHKAIEDASKPFILWHLYFPKVFKENGGFDIVIGNPPYIGQSGNKDIFREVKETDLGKKFHQRRMDFHYFFYHKGLDLLTPNGHLMLITTNYFLDATNADKLREDIQERSCICQIINFNELKIFESAMGQHNLIMMLQKTKNDKTTKTCLVSRKGFANGKILKDIFNGIEKEAEYNSCLCSELFNPMNGQINIKSTTDLVEVVLEKMAQMKHYLGEVSTINQGIVTGCNKISKKHLTLYPDMGWHLNQGIFVLSKNELDDLKLNTNEMELIKPWFKNSDIHKWFTEEETEEFLIYYATKNNYVNVDNIKRYLDQYKPILINRNVRTGSVTEEQYKAFLKNEYDISYVMIASEMKAENYYCVSYAREKVVFETPKIVVPQRSKENTFGYTDKVWYGATDVYFINQKDSDVDLFYLLGLLNSKLYYFWLYHRGKRKGDTLELFLKPLSEIPVPLDDKIKKATISDLAQQLNAAYKQKKNEESKTMLEEKLNMVIYELFGLTEDEIEVVESL